MILKKILISSHTGNYLGGAEKSLRLFLKYCSVNKQNLKVIIPHKGWQGDLQSQLESDNIPTLLLNKQSDKTPFEKYILSPLLLLKRVSGIIRFACNYYKVLKKFKPDVVYLNTIYCLSDALIAYLSGFPVVLHIRGMDNNLTGIRQIRMVLFGAITKQIITVDSESKSLMENHNTVFKNKIKFIPNGIPLNEVIFDVNKIKRYVSKVKKDNIVFGCIGTVSERKDTKAFAKIAFNIVQKHDNVVFCWVGDYQSTKESRSIYAEILTKYADLIKDEKLVFTGYQADPYNWISMFDLLLFTSKKEGMPRTLLEAMAVKRLIISFAIDGVKDLLEDNETGYIIPPFDYNAMEERIEQILLNGIPENLIHQAHQSLLNNFTQTKVTKEIEKVLSACASNAKNNPFS